jgi:uncharacterized protein (TIGR00299 family) protein
MLLGALLGLGAPLDTVTADLTALAVEGWAVEQRTTSRCGISATRAVVTVSGPGGDDHDHHHDHHHHDHHHHRSWSAIDHLLETAQVPPAVAGGARRTFALLAQVESAIHQVDVDEVHFHEVGAIDALIDIVGTWSALHHLGVDRVHAGPIGLGSGTVSTAHGLLPAPAPATLDLLAGLPVRPVASTAETVTPTGAALLATMVDRWGPIPVGRIGTTSRGAGGRDPDTHPNVVTAVLLTGTDPVTGEDEPVGSSAAQTEAVVVATNLDDVTPEVIAHTIQQLLDAGADDAWVVPVTMKKGRSGHELRALTTPERAPALRHLVFQETGTLGVRSEPVTKHHLAREWRMVSVQGHPVAIKVSPHGAKPEHNDLAAASQATGIPIRHLAAEAIRLHSGVEREFGHSEGPH